MFSELEELAALGGELGHRARAAGVLLIWRAQTRSSKQLVVCDGKLEGNSASSISGHGIQVVTPGGHVALASRDDFRPEKALELLAKVIGTAAAGADLGLERIQPSSLPTLRARELPADLIALSEIDLKDASRRVIEIESELRGRVAGVRLRLSYSAELEAWRIFRSDGTDVFFAVPRSILNLRATASGGDSRHSVSASVFRPRPTMLWEEEPLQLFLKRAESAAHLARELPDAPSYPAGSYPLLIDYALAKGLAHEAFGHASEADSFRSSILAREGRFRTGERVGAGHLSIIDEPQSGDHAWQPFSANGLRRERAVLVDHGRLCDGLSDPWSAGPGGVRLTGAGRANSFRDAPQPRMSNIRIEVDTPLPAPGEFEDYGPLEAHELLQQAGVFKRHPKVVYLSGYTGGQVNTAVGDFVFNCRAMYELSSSGATLYKPAIFAGSMFGALESVREAFGPLKLDAIGYCGKWGQQVPSSGGSHYFLMLEPASTVRLGGK